MKNYKQKMTVTCKVGISRFLSEQWVSLATLVWGMPVIDQIRIAKTALNESIQKLVACDKPLRQELCQISVKVRQIDKASMKTAMVNQLKRSVVDRNSNNPIQTWWGVGNTKNLLTSKERVGGRPATDTADNIN